MNFLLQLSSRTWIIALFAACGFLMWIDAARIRRVDFISGLAEPVPIVDTASLTGYSAGLRRLVVPEHNHGSYQWIAQTQQMLSRHEWRVRHVDYDNAPFGREVRSPSPYRWWLGLVAWCGHALSGQPLGLAVERAALLADPILQLLLLTGAVIFTARQFGTFPATLLAVGLTVTFPFAGTFLPGQPGDGGLTHFCAFWSVLLLLAGTSPPRTMRPGSDQPRRNERRRQFYFFAAGIVGGIGLWVSPLLMFPILAGITAGGINAAWLVRRASPTSSSTTETAPWRIWALGGAATSLVAYVIEYFPEHMDGLRLETIHPLFGLAWLGVGEVLEQTVTWLQRKKSPWMIRRTLILLLAAVAIAAVPVVMMRTSSRGIGANDAITTRLTNLPNSPQAQNLRTWIERDGLTSAAMATLLPLLLLVPSIWSLTRIKITATHGQAVALALGPVLVALALACFQLSWWSMLDGALLALLAAATSASDSSRNPKFVRCLWSGGFVLVMAPAVVLLVATMRTETGDVIAETEVEALIERDLSYWLSNQAAVRGAVVLAPPSLTTSLYFHGGLTGLGTPYWENKDGFTAAVRIAGASTPDEAQAMAQSRGLTYIILPSWDPFLDEYARLGSGQFDHSLVALLHHWLPPRWLRPVPYHLPKIAGFEGLSAVIFEVVDVQDDATALSRLAEYFVEMDQIDLASSVSQALERFFPSDFGAMVARSLVEQASGDTAGFARAINELQTSLARGDDSDLSWDRRVSLAIALTEGKRFELAREQTTRCLKEIDQARLRSLTTVSLYRLQMISKAFGLRISDPQLQLLARELLPLELRNNL